MSSSPHFEKEGGKAMFFVVVSFESFISLSDSDLNQLSVLT
jgi:hypothetical protein